MDAEAHDISMGLDYRERDPVLRLLPPDPPDAFARLPDADQHYRGRVWLILWSAGYEQDHAWWFALTDNQEWLDAIRPDIVSVSDDTIPLMVKGRMDFERGKTMTSGTQ